MAVEELEATNLPIGRTLKKKKKTSMICAIDILR